MAAGLLVEGACFEQYHRAVQHVGRRIDQRPAPDPLIGGQQFVDQYGQPTHILGTDARLEAVLPHRQRGGGDSSEFTQFTASHIVLLCGRGAGGRLSRMHDGCGVIQGQRGGEAL
ncbi:hypothetical protein IU449_25880 [Nocardia higoensis]|uniref:Uncharacterized protein n=1 Tax=Nocardia higoensis TaxID=228599 RepID=A0ABS0DHJ8_9NOCA|nr:hypothetical protein [Nocardia higoensis]